MEGTYVLTATLANAVALAPIGARHTAFTGELLTLLRAGVPDGPALLTFSTIYRRLLYTTTSRGLPIPRQCGTGTVDLLALTRNPAATVHETGMYPSLSAPPSSAPGDLHTRPVTINQPASSTQEAEAASRTVLDIAGTDPDPWIPDSPTPPVPSSSDDEALVAHQPRRRIRPVVILAFGLAVALLAATLIWTLRPDDRLIAELTGDTANIWEVAFSPDGKILATASGTTVRLWDVANRRQIGDPLTGHTETVTDLAFSPDGKILATASGATGSSIYRIGDKTIRLWDVANRTQIGDPLTTVHIVGDLMFSPDGKTLASAHDDTTQLWDVATRQPSGSPLPRDNLDIRDNLGITAVAFSPDGKTLAAASRGGKIRFWDVATRKNIGNPINNTSQGVDRGVCNLAFRPNGAQLATTDCTAFLQIWNVTERTKIDELHPRRHTNTKIYSVAFSPDGKTFVTGEAQEARLWDADTRQPIGSPFSHPVENNYIDKPVSSVAFSPDGKTLATVGANTVRLWKITG